MILKSFKLFPQNVQKNKTLIDSILESYIDFDILFIQNPYSYSFALYQVPQTNSIVGILNHSNWITFFRYVNDNNNYPHVISYINMCLSYLCFSLWKNIFNHKDINCFFIFNNGNIFFMLNVYSDDHQTTLKYLKNTEVNLWNILIMTSDFNIRDNI